MIENRDDFIACNLGLVHACCHKMQGKGIEYDDLFGAGCVGLVKAVDGFDVTRGICFSTYAVPVILGEIKRLFRDGGSVKVARSLKELSLKCTRERERLTKKLGREPTVSELAEKLGVTPEEAAEALSVARPAVSLTYSDEDGETGEIELVDDRENEMFQSLVIGEALSRLKPRDRELILLRYFVGKTQSETAAALGMSQVQVSRSEKKILAQMRQNMT